MVEIVNTEKPRPMPTKLTPEIITAAILGFEEQKRHIDAQIAELRAMLSAGPAATRARIAQAQRKRWAASKKAGASSVPIAAPKPKRKLSRAGRAAIVAATKRRWALKRAEAAKAQPAKKTTQKKAAVNKLR